MPKRFRLELTIAARYLLAKKSHNAINAITIVAACGVAIITAALICVLSVYNGFEKLVGQLSSQLDPELKIVAIEGKYFNDTPQLRQLIAGCDDVEYVSTTLQETVLIVNGGRQIPAQMKGVDSLYEKVTQVDSILWNGDYLLCDPVADYAILGIGLSQLVSCRPGFLRPMTFYCPRREGKIDLTRPEEAFVEHQFFCSGQFAVRQADYDDALCLVSLKAARTLLQDSTLASAYELKMRAGCNIDAALDRIGDKLRDHGLQVLNRHEQQADNYRIVQIEKWVTFLLVLFILLIASFNIVGALSMLIIDKEQEINSLVALGADESMVRRIFALEGCLISGTGAAVGIVLGAALCLLQEHFGLIGLGDGSDIFVVDSYPVSLLWSDLIWSAIAVLAIGLTATIIPTLRISIKTQS